VTLSFRQQRRERRRWPLLAFFGTAIGAWVMGLAWFAGEMPAAPLAEIPKTDAVVVLTGGTRRVAAGLELLARGDGKKLLVSGVHPDVVKDEIAGADPRVRDLADCCVALGYQATDTIGNAEETARWMRQERFSSLTLVTATYHMPRSLAEFRRALPEARIVAYPVFPEPFKRDGWWHWPGSAALVILEYHKYALAQLRFGLADLIGPRERSEPVT
jgi:uncharacterized SAM-binding protein YcdF (DUF218 family)